MRVVPVKSREEQALLVAHKSRDLLVRQRTSLINALRGHLAEFGLVAGKGDQNLQRLIAAFGAAGPQALPELARPGLAALIDQIAALELAIHQAEAQILAWHKHNAQSQRLATIPGVGPITATALIAAVGDVSRFRSGRHLAAWLGLTPRQHSSGGKERLAGISKMGNRYLRRLLVNGATSLIRRANGSTAPHWGWVRALLARRPARLVSVALANKAARVAWAILARGEVYERRPTAA
jgi:transposase